MSLFDASMGGLPFNPLVPPVDPTTGRANPVNHLHQVAGILKRIYRLGDQQTYALREAMKETYAIAAITGPFVPTADQTSLAFDAIREILVRDSHTALLGRLSPIFDLELFGAPQANCSWRTSSMAGPSSV